MKLLSRAADLLPPGDPFRLGVLPDLGFALAQSDIPRAEAVLTEAIEGGRAIGDRQLEARAGTRRVFVRLLLDPQVDQQRSLEETEHWLRVFQGSGDEVGLAEARRVVGIIHFWQGRAAVAEEDLKQAIGHAERAGDRRQEAEALRFLPIALLNGPTPVNEAIRRLESISDRALGDRRVDIAVVRVQAELEAMRGRFDTARALIARGKSLARQLGDQVALAAVLRHSGYVEMLDGDPAAAEAEVREGHEILERISDWGHLASHAPDLGEAVYAQGRYDDALRLSESAERITIEGDVDAEIRWRQLRAKVLARRGQMAEAESRAREAVRIASGTDYLDIHAQALFSLSEVLRLADRNAEAVSFIREAFDLCRRKGNVVAEARAGSMLQDLEG